MSVFPVPPAWVAGSLTSANLNTLSSDATWLKNALDLITANTASDTGDSTRIDIKRATNTVNVFTARVTGDANDRFQALVTGKLSWGGGPSPPDIDLSRSGVGELTLSGRLLATALQPTSATDAINIPNGYMEINERSGGDPAAPAANWCRLYLRDAAGKTQLVARFSSGAIQVIATQP